MSNATNILLAQKILSIARALIETEEVHAGVKAAYDHINFKPPEGVARAAEHGLALRKKFGRGGTGVGVARARDLKNRKTMSPSTIKRMVSFFARHEVDKKGKNWGSKSSPSNGYIAWLLWGGDAGRAWCNKVSRQMKAADNK